MTSPEQSPKNGKPNFYNGAYRGEALALELVIKEFSLSKPITLYYPGSSMDVSFAGISGVHTIHADRYFTDLDIDRFKERGLDARIVDAVEYQPPEEIDIIALINPYGFNYRDAIDKSGLRQEGLIMFAGWGGEEETLYERDDLRLVAVCKSNDNDDFVIDTEELGDYFTTKPFDTLSDDERSMFEFSCTRAQLPTTDTEGNFLPSEVKYDLLQEPQNNDLLLALKREGAYAGLPQKKTGTFYIFQRL